MTPKTDMTREIEMMYESSVFSPTQAQLEQEARQLIKTFLGEVSPINYVEKVYARLRPNGELRFLTVTSSKFGDSLDDELYDAQLTIVHKAAGKYLNPDEKPVRAHMFYHVRPIFQCLQGGGLTKNQLQHVRREWAPRIKLVYQRS